MFQSLPNKEWHKNFHAINYYEFMYFSSFFYFVFLILSYSFFFFNTISQRGRLSGDNMMTFFHVLYEKGERRQATFILSPQIFFRFVKILKPNKIYIFFFLLPK